MPPPQEESLRSLLTRSDFASLDVPLAKLCTWIGDGWLEQVGTAPTADGSTGEPVYAIISRQLRAELLPKLERIGKTAAALTPMRARSQLLRLMLARKGILLPFDHGDDIVSVKTRLIEELAAGLLGPDLARALEDAAADLEREVEAALQQLDGKTLPEVFGTGVEPSWTEVEARAEPRDEAEDEDDDAEEAAWFDTSDLLDETSVWSDEALDDPEDGGEPAEVDTVQLPLEEIVADAPTGDRSGEHPCASSSEHGAAGEVAPEDGDNLAVVDTDAPVEATVADAAPELEAGGEVAAEDGGGELESDAKVESETAIEADDEIAPEDEDDLEVVDTDALAETVADTVSEFEDDWDGTTDDIGGELQIVDTDAEIEAAPSRKEVAPTDSEAAAPFADAADMMLCVDAVMAADGGSPPNEAAATEQPKEERVTEAELASLAGASELLDFGVTFHDGLTEEDVAERLVPQVSMAITDTLVAMLGDESAPLAGSLSQGSRIDLQPLTHELEQLRLATEQLGQRERPAVDLNALMHEVEQMRAAVQQLAGRPLTVDTTAVTQELSRLCSLVELLADRRSDPPGIQKIASALELGFARLAAAPTEMIAGIKQIGSAIADAQAAHTEATRTLPRPQPRGEVAAARTSGGSLVPVAVIGLLLVCWAVVLYVKFGDARLALGSLLAVSMIGSTLVAFRRD